MEDREAIQMAINEFISAYNAGDLAGVLACYSDDLIKVRQGALPETKPEVARRLAEVFEKYLCKVAVRNDEIWTAGEQAFCRGSFQVTLTPKSGGETLQIDRRFLEIWRKEGGRWLVARTMDNAG